MQENGLDLLVQKADKAGGCVKLARKLGISHVTVSRWLNRKRKPDLKKRQLLFTKLRIPLTAIW